MNLIFALALVATAPGVAGSHLEFFDEKWICLDKALRVEWVSAGGERIPGCWTVGPGFVQAVFLDGDFARVPQEVLVRTKRL